MKIERECNGYTYTGENDDDRSNWQVTTDYINSKVYIDMPGEDEELDEIKAFGKAIVKAVADMRRENKDNRFEVK